MLKDSLRLIKMDSSSNAENDVKDCKYDPSVLQNTLHKHLLGIVDKIEPQKKHAFLDILSNSLNSILSCSKCKSPLKENSSSFNCGHKYCEQCIKDLKKCTTCNEGIIRTNIKNFSSILSILNEIKSNFNSDKVIYEMMRYLLMPQKFSHVEEVVETAEPNVECTPCDSSLADNVTVRKSRKSAFNGKKPKATPSALKNSRKKLEFNKELNESKNSNSESLFLETNKNKEKVTEKRQSYLELQPTISGMNKDSTPISNTKRKRNGSDSYLELQPTVSETPKNITPVSSTTRKRKTSDSESSDRSISKSKRVKTKNNSEDSLIEDENPAPRSLRKRTPRQKMKSPQRLSDPLNQGIFSGFDNRQSVECFNKLEVLLNCFDAERHVHESRHSMKLSSNVDVLSATGEEKQPYVTETKVKPIFNSIKNLADEVKKPFIPVHVVDADVLDPDVWKRNDRYEKKKNLFKSVKERNKRSISIGGNLESLLEQRKPTPKKQSPPKLDINRVGNKEIKKDTEIDFSKNEEEPNGGIVKNLLEHRKLTPRKQSPPKLDVNMTGSSKMKKDSEMNFSKNEKESNAIDSAKEKTAQIEEIHKEPVSKIENTNNRTQKKPVLQIMLQRVTPMKQSPTKSDNNVIENTEVRKDVEILFTNEEKKVDKDSKSINTSEKKKTSKPVEIIEELAPEVPNTISEVNKEPAQVSVEIEKPINKEAILTEQTKDKTPSTGEIVKEPVLEKESSKASSREILAEITDPQQNAMNVANPIEKHKTPLSSAKSATPGKRLSKLGLPLFSETNSDIFSQKGNLCSSTPCVETMKKVTKTYSRSKSNLFNKSIPEINPIDEERNFDDVLTFPDLSPIVEKKKIEDEFIISDEATRHQKDIKIRSKFPSAEESFDMIGNTQMIVVADVHEVPVTPTTHLLKETPKPIQSEKPNVLIEPAIFETPPVKNTRLDEIIPMEIDNVFDTVDKVTDNILSKTLESNIDLEDEIQPVDSDAERETRRNKVKKLQESINSKTEKTLSSLKKNFNKSTSKLSVEKVKSGGSSTTPAKSSCQFTPIKPAPLTDPKELNVTPASMTLSKELPTDYDNAPTQIRGTPTKSVACQTSPDLHLALLKQEFPHLFEKHASDSAKKFPLSVYDTPTEPINEGVKITAKTPDVGLLNTTAKFTRVSSITSSEKKLVDERFMDESILGNASFNVISANKTTNISGYTPLSPLTQNGKKKLSCRLNFDDDDDEKEQIPEEMPPSVSTDLDGDKVMKNTLDFSIEGDIAIKNVIDFGIDEDVAIKNAPDFSIDRSEEIEFSDDVNDKKDEEVMLSASILENSNPTTFPVESSQSKTDDANKTFFEFDKPVTPVSFTAKAASTETKEDTDSTLVAIPDTDDVVQKDDDKNEVVTDDDDDIDFIAGTPTSQPRRLLTDNLEKIRTPHALSRKPLDITLHEFSIVGNTTPNMSSIHPLPDMSQYSAVKKPTSVEVTPIDEPAKKKDIDAVSLELFNSSVSVLSPTSEKILIATSGLKEPELKIIMEFCEKFSATYVDKLTDESTHLVVKTNHKNKTARTFKYLQAIVSQIRIVSMKWIHECLTKEKLINEEKFIPLDSSGECGPLRTFHVLKGVTPSPLSWLNDYCIYFTKPVPQECTLEQLQSIMRKAGAFVVDSLGEFMKYPKHHHIIIVSDDEDCDDEYNMKIAGWLQSYEAVSVEFNWILEVIGRNRLMPFADFEVIEIPNEYLLRRNFPAVMLQSNEEDENSSD